ncbi:MAG: signal peptidase II [Ignavibacteria bacterium]
MKIFYITFFIVLTDQITKILVKGIHISALGINIKGMQLYDSFNVIGDFFRITYIENPGMAFGIDFGEKAKLFLTLFSLIASIFITYFLIKHKNEKLSLRLPLAMILGGAVGNLIDRMFYGLIYGDAPLFYGKVVDFLDFDFFNISLFGYSYDRWPIFNIADMSVTIGVILLIILHREPKEEKQLSTEEEFKNQNKGYVSENFSQSNAIESISSTDEVHS